MRVRVAKHLLFRILILVIIDEVDSREILICKLLTGQHLWNIVCENLSNI